MKNNVGLTVAIIGARSHFRASLVNHREAASPAQSTFSPVLCLAIGSAIGFVAFLVWLLLAAFG
ncbi:MAG TPA: hypothetical protein VGF58_07805 [Burkholderiales bacterium]